MHDHAQKNISRYGNAKEKRFSRYLEYQQKRHAQKEIFGVHEFAFIYISKQQCYSNLESLWFQQRAFVVELKAQLISAYHATYLMPMGLESTTFRL